VVAGAVTWGHCAVFMCRWPRPILTIFARQPCVVEHGLTIWPIIFRSVCTCTSRLGVHRSKTVTPRTAPAPPSYQHQSLCRCLLRHDLCFQSEDENGLTRLSGRQPLGGVQCSSTFHDAARGSRSRPNAAATYPLPKYTPQLAL
jgi:hypothetical protein